MSKKNNVNPGQYKVAGRERQGEEVDHAAQKARLAESLPAVKGEYPAKSGAKPADTRPDQ